MDDVIKLLLLLLVIVVAVVLLLVLLVLLLALLLLVLLVFDSIIGLCSSIKSFKFGLITLRYSLGDKFSCFSALLVYSI